VAEPNRTPTHSPVQPPSRRPLIAVVSVAVAVLAGGLIWWVASQTSSPWTSREGLAGRHVSNVRLTRDSSQSQQVNVAYDLAPTADGVSDFTVKVDIFPEGTDRAAVPTAQLAGDVGDKIHPGQKHFVWNAAQDAPDITLDKLQVRVDAEPVTPPPTPRGPTPPVPSPPAPNPSGPTSSPGPAPPGPEVPKKTGPPTPPPVSQEDLARAARLVEQAREAHASGDTVGARGLYDHALKLTPNDRVIQRERNGADAELRREANLNLTKADEAWQRETAPDYDGALKIVNTVLNWFPNDERAKTLKTKITKARDTELRRAGRSGGMR
jgi:hypothetical protein